MSKEKDKVILSYGDSLIRESDLKLLDGPLWLNDRLITFHFEYLYEQEYQCSSKLAFISPEVSQFVKMAAKNEIEIFLEPLNLPEKELIVMAVNNSNDPDRPGGSHWSLLMYSSQARKFLHFDSSGGMNSDAARQLAIMVFGYLSSSLNQRHDFIIEEVPVLQQKNGYDCGIHLICNSSHATRHIFINGHYDTLDKLSESIVKQKRSELKKLILDLGSRN